MPYASGQIILDKYRIEALVGRGAFAEVYRATHIPLNAVRALKVLRRDAPGLGSTEYSDYRQRFQLEAQLGAQLDHPNVIRIYDFEQDGDTLILVMEYVERGSLAEVLARVKQKNQRIPVSGALRIASDVAEGLAVLHAADVVHRDLKPSNILFDAQGRAKVADLGLAQISHGPSMRSQLSAPQPHPGTPAYMSPEQQMSGAYLTPTSDVYALGLVLFEILTGRVYRNVRPGIRARELREDVPRTLDDLLARMLSEDPNARPWDGAETGSALAATQVEPARDARHNLQRAWPWLAGLMAFAVLIVIGLAVAKNLRATESPATLTIAPIVVVNGLTPHPHTESLTAATTRTPLPTPAETSTPTPATTSTPAFTPNSTPALTPVPSPSATPTSQPTATPRCSAISGPFAAAWNAVQDEIGCATGNATSGLVAEESFQRGKMFWREPIDYAQALVVFNNGTWRIFQHSPFIEGSPDFSCPDENTPSQCPPTPKRGFGMMWCDMQEIRGGLGNATDCEHGYQGIMQEFEQGFMLRSSSGTIYVFYANGQWTTK